MCLPKTIFKYEGISNNSLINLKSQSIYMASPLLFNDPYDSSLSFQINELTDSDVLFVKNKYMASDIPDAIKDQIKDMTVDNFKTILQRTTFNAININQQSFLKMKGVCCFSESNNELLMWAHYSDSYKGFCLEFRTEFEPFKSMKHVKYIPQLPKLDISTLLVNSNYDQLIDLYCTKNMIWGYEKEWRIIHNVVGTVYTYPMDSLKAIYFGPKMNDVYKEILCLILQGQNPQVEFWNGELMKSEFGIKFEKFTYTSYSKAIELGLV